VRRSSSGWLALATLLATGPASAQSPVQVQAGLGYARVFDGGGISLAAGVDRPVFSSSASLRHALGLGVWYAHTQLASAPEQSVRRNLVGIGARYELGLRNCCGSLRPFLPLPVLVLRSSVEDRATLQAMALSSHGVPQPPETIPIQDQPGAAWGWGAGLELGTQLALGEGLSAQTSIEGLYQDIYAGSTSHGGWNWQAGLAYTFSPVAGTGE
jgi:hypothetical protein